MASRIAIPSYNYIIKTNTSELNYTMVWGLLFRPIITFLFSLLYFYYYSYVRFSRYKTLNHRMYDDRRSLYWNLFFKLVHSQIIILLAIAHYLKLNHRYNSLCKTVTMYTGHAVVIAVLRVNRSPIEQWMSGTSEWWLQAEGVCCYVWASFNYSPQFFTVSYFVYLETEYVWKYGTIKHAAIHRASMHGGNGHFECTSLC